MKKIIGAFLAILVMAVVLWANVPAPYWPCDQKKVGDPCKWGYGCGNNGVCAVKKDCKDEPGTSVNECLLCDTN
ncbi:MAG: hypothetical protein GY754_25080 [bacterium]|nr:hypothetical protein [bacterium]